MDSKRDTPNWQLTAKDFTQWKIQCKKLLGENTAPDKVIWVDAAYDALGARHQTMSPTSDDLFSGVVSAPLHDAQIEEPCAADIYSADVGSYSGPRSNKELEQLSPLDLSLPRQFIEQAQKVGCFRSADTWHLLYRMVWEMTRGHRNLLQDSLHPDVIEFQRRAQNVHRSAHKMKAFLRFKKVESAALEYWVAWFEPVHKVLAITAPFFQRRFPNMRWSIWTPDGSAHHLDGQIAYGHPAPFPLDMDDTFERYWKTYYRNTFNPSRANPRLMKSEMPVVYWKHLPEATEIPALLHNARQATQAMLLKNPSEADAKRGLSKGLRATQDRLREKATTEARMNNQRTDGRSELAGRLTTEASTGQNNHFHPVLPLSVAARENELRKLKSQAEQCQQCPLYKSATQTVFGVGPADAPLLVLGEQPGDQEDIAGYPFTGPAGHCLKTAMCKADLPREKSYFTNAVKHFKWKPQGKRRLHMTPSSREIAACAHWLDQELAIVQPRIILALGRTAAERILGRTVKLTAERGTLQTLVEDSKEQPGVKLMVTYHPSYLLRVEEATRARVSEEFEQDLRMVSEALREGLKAGDAIW